MNSWSEETVFHDGDRFFEALLQEIGRARANVDLETYIFDRDELGDRVLSALGAAARRGIRVRLLLDGVGSASWTLRDLKKARSQGVDVRVFHPLPWQNPKFEFFRSLAPQRWLLSLGKLNRRNHRKTCIIDDRIAFLGGMNVSARHLNRSPDLPGWRDTSARVLGDDVRLLSQAFEEAWSRKSRGSSLSSPLVRLNSNRLQRRGSYAELIQRLLSAQNRVWITNPYFVPEFAVLRALRFSAWTGKDVRILVPRRNDVWGMKWAINAFYFILLSAGVKIHEYSPTILHAKTLLIDDWATVGSSNFNHRSIFHDLEVDAVLALPSSIHSLETQFLIDLSQSHPVDPGSWGKRPWGRRALERLVLVFRRWL